MSIGTQGKIAVLGAGATGLSLAQALISRGQEVEVFERETQVGGHAKSLVLDGFRCDLGVHRWVPRSETVWTFLRNNVGNDLLPAVRSHVILIDGNVFSHPFALSEYLKRSPFYRRLPMLGNAIWHRWWAKVRPVRRNLAEHVLGECGRIAYQKYCKPLYTKTTGMSPYEIAPAFGRPFIGDRTSSLIRATFGLATPDPGQRTFVYPRLGSGQVWDRVADDIHKKGGKIHLGAHVMEIESNGSSGSGSTQVQARLASGHQMRDRYRKVVSTIPLPDLMNYLQPSPDADLMEQAGRLRRHGLVCVYFWIDRTHFLPYDAIYVPDPDVLFYIVEDFSFASPFLSPAGTTSVCAQIEIFEETGVWAWPDDVLVTEVRAQMGRLGFSIPDNELIGFHVARVRDARPDPRWSSRTLVDGLLEHVEARGIASVGRLGGMTPLLSMDAAVEIGLMTAERLCLET